jgi:hypothetical protein
MRDPKNSLARPLLLAGGIGLVVILLAAFSGVIQNYFTTEEFYVLHYAHNLPHMQAWQDFFAKNGRLIEGIYWTYEYELLGFNPLASHSLSFVLLLILAILASACFTNAWPHKKSKSLPYLFVFLFFTNWISAKAVFRLSYDNIHISLIFFFLAGLILQRWATSQRHGWLFLSIFTFLLSTLTYENAVFLFPALLFLAWPLLPVSKKGLARSEVFLFIGLGVVSGLSLLIPRWIYSFTSRQHVVAGAIQESLIKVLEAGPLVYLRFGQFFTMSPLNYMIGTGILLALGLSLLWMFRLHKGTDIKMSTKTRLRWTCIFAACIWLLAFGPLPYVILGYEPGPRVYSSGVFGIFPLLLLALQSSKRVLSILVVIMILFFAGLGLYTFRNESIAFIQGEAALNVFFRGMKEAIPHVRPNTIFLFVNGPPLGIPGCGPSLEMLYDQRDLSCGSFWPGSPDPVCPAIRDSGGVEVDCQYFAGENWILVSTLGGTPTLLEELKPGDFNLSLAWESKEPLVTDHHKLDVKEFPPPSEFYLHLLRRAAVLFTKP